jgi:hypothetical protein
VKALHHIIYYYNNFDREGPGGADVYILFEYCYPRSNSMFQVLVILLTNGSVAKGGDKLECSRCV